MKMHSGIFWFVLVFLLLIGLRVLIPTEDKPVTKNPVEPEDLVQSLIPDSRSALISQPKRQPASSPANRDVSPMADELNAEDSTAAKDIEIIQTLFEAYRGFVRKGNPVGTNAEITRSLCGVNECAYAPLPNHHPAISAEGELLDRWGTPYFFHQLSASQMKIRSAGPDRKLRTEDDIVR